MKILHTLCAGVSLSSSRGTSLLVVFFFYFYLFFFFFFMQRFFFTLSLSSHIFRGCVLDSLLVICYSLFLLLLFAKFHILQCSYLSFTFTIFFQTCQGIKTTKNLVQFFFFSIKLTFSKGNLISLVKNMIKLQFYYSTIV